MRSIVVVSLLILAGCGNVVSARDSGVIGDGALSPRQCGLNVCSESQSCCLATGSCFDSTRPELCRGEALGDAAVNHDAAAPDANPSRCFSNADCRADEFCYNEFCLGEGRCGSRTEGITCMSVVVGAGVVCGCDGTNYTSLCTARAAGVRVASPTACGEVPRPNRPNQVGYTPPIGCADDTQCPSAMSCCPLLRRCVRRGCDACCAIPRPGSLGTCERDTDCETSDLFCDGAGCAGPGECKPKVPISSCSGVVENVCGCDGRTYLNACQLQSAGVRLRATGMCPSR